MRAKKPDRNKQHLHKCETPEWDEVMDYTPKYGWAVETCWEDESGILFVGNGEYSNPVNFCPICGYQAKIQIPIKVRTDDQEESGVD